MRNGLNTPAKVWGWFHHIHQHIIQTIFLTAENGDNFITEDGTNTFITEESDL